MFTIYSLYFQCRLLSMLSPVTEWLSSVVFFFAIHPSWHSWLVCGLRCVRSRVRSPVTPHPSVSTSLLSVYMPTLPEYLGVSRIRHRSPALPYGSPWARSIQPKFRPVRPGKVVHLQRWTRFFKTFPVGPNQGRTDRLSFGPKFPEILVVWIAPHISRIKSSLELFCALLFEI